MQIKGYCGICAICFEPIKDGELFKFRDPGRNFHKRCALNNPTSYYAKLEGRLRIKPLKRRKSIYG